VKARPTPAAFVPPTIPCFNTLRLLQPPVKGAIPDGYRTATRAKEVVEEFHRANARKGTGMRAFYLGRRKPSN
jgi:hypothetical protein